MTTSPLVASIELGAQQPRILTVPPFSSSSGDEAVELAAMAGLILDPWEAFVLSQSLGERPDGKWAAFEVGVMVSRQNGKGSILEARELAGLFILDERLIIHSAHQFDTSLEAFRRLLMLIEDCPDLDRRVMRVSKSHGEEGIELKKNARTGLRQRIRFRTRTKGGGRGFTGDCLILDEAMMIPEAFHGGLLPTLSARPNPQVWYTGSAVDQDVMEHGVVFARVRERGMKGEPALAYFEWSVESDLPDLPASVAEDPELWALANPAMGIRISVEHTGHEYRSMDSRTFQVERLGIGDWPATDGTQGRAMDPVVWAGLTDIGSTITGPVFFAFDVTPDRSAGAIGVAGLRGDGLMHVEVVDHRRGTDWITDRLVELTGRHKAPMVVADLAGPGGSLAATLEAAGVKLLAVNAREHAQGCGIFFDAVSQGVLRHLGTPELAAAIAGATKRPLGDAAWAWNRKNSAVDIAPLVAVTLAMWGFKTHAPKRAPRVIDLSALMHESED